MKICILFGKHTESYQYFSILYDIEKLNNFSKALLARNQVEMFDYSMFRKVVC